MAILLKIDGEIDSSGNVNTSSLINCEHSKNIYKLLCKHKTKTALKFVVYLIKSYESIMADLILIRKTESKNKIYFRKDFVLVIKNTKQH